MSAITVSGLTKVYPGGTTALDGVDLAIEDGEFFALLGPSGCGKTTLLRTLAGLETATSGTIALGGRDVTSVPPGRREVAMVFQDYALFPHMTVTDNIAYPLRVRKVPAARRRETARAVAAELELSELLDRRPGQLSGGQQQRVALARAMACRPRAFLLDEPLSNLDARMRLSARTFLKRLQRELRVTTVFVTHDQAEALALADRVAVMENGRVRQIGSPREVFQRPASTFVASFIGATPMNLLSGAVAPSGHLGVGAPADAEAPARPPLRLGAGPARRRRHRHAGRRRRRFAGGHGHRHAGRAGVGRRARGLDHRHHVLEADRGEQLMVELGAAQRPAHQQPLDKVGNLPHARLA